MIFYENISKSSNFFLEVPTLADGRRPEGQNDKFENPDTNVYPSKN